MILLLLACAGATNGPPSILLVSLDTLRADRLAAYGNTDGITPNLNRFAADATVFTHADTQATHTTEAHSAVFTGRYPMELFDTSKVPDLRGVPTLAEVLRICDYQTAAFVAGGSLAPEYGLTKGFDTYESPTQFGSFFHTVPPSLAWLDSRRLDAPFFLFVHSYDAHQYQRPTPWGYLYADGTQPGPWQDAGQGAAMFVADGALLPGSAAIEATDSMLRPRSTAGRARLAALNATTLPRPRAFSDADTAQLRKVYDGGASYADAWFGTLMAVLEQRGLLDDTLVAVMSDHGEELGERGVFDHSYGVTDATANVVLMVKLPRQHEGRVVTERVGLLDVFPTLIELAGAPLPAVQSGASFAPALRGEAFTGRAFTVTGGSKRMNSYSIADATGRLTYTGPPPAAAGLPEIVETALLPGPGFESDAPGADAERLRGKLVAWMRDTPRRMTRSANGLSAEQQKVMRENGYFDAGAP